MESYTVYANINDNPVYTCPQCETSEKTKLAPRRILDKGTIEFKCACGSRFAVSPENRRHRRKLTNLAGSYIIPSDSSKKEFIKVLNLSIGGIGFTTRKLHALSVGDRIKLTFTLDDEKQSEVRAEGIVRHIICNYVGCEFTETPNRDANLAFYLMP